MDLIKKRMTKTYYTKNSEMYKERGDNFVSVDLNNRAEWFLDK